MPRVYGKGTLDSQYTRRCPGTDCYYPSVTSRNLIASRMMGGHTAGLKTQRATLKKYRTKNPRRVATAGV